MSYQRSSFDKFVAASGKFGQTEAQILKWLCEDSVAGNRHELLEKLTQHFMKKEGRIPKRVHAIWSQIDSLVATYGDRKTTIGIRWGEYGKLSPRALLDEERPKVDINLVAGSGGFKLEPLIDYY